MDEDLLLQQLSDGEGNFLLPSREWEVEQAPQPIGFHSICRGVSRLGAIFAGSLSLSLLVRTFPIFGAPYAIVLTLGVAVGIAYTIIPRQTSQRLTALLILAFVFGGMVGGWWDAIYWLIKDGSPVVRVAGVIASLLVAGGFMLLLQGGKD